MRGSALLAALAFVALASSRKGGGAVQSTSNSGGGGAPKPRRPERSLDLLVPSFKAKVQQLLRAMQARGFRPLVWETLRSRERAEQLAEKGTGRPDSMHIYGLAVDVIDAERMWDHPAFFAALGVEAEKLGLTWGGRWSSRDLPHVQAMPVALQTTMRAASLAERERILRERYA
jgi:hypothetical protein